MPLWLSILASFAKVGLFAYGGGPSMIPVMEHEVVNVNHWLKEKEFIDAFAMGNALPGPIATKMSAYIGYRLLGLPGAILGVVGTVLPSFILMLLLGIFLWHFRDSTYVQGALKAVRPAVVALLVVVVFDFAPPSIRSWHTAAIAVVTFLVIVIFKIHPAWAIAGAALLGVLIY